jgi:hypothetical protein
MFKKILKVFIILIISYSSINANENKSTKLTQNKILKQQNSIIKEDFDFLIYYKGNNKEINKNINKVFKCMLKEEKLYSKYVQTKLKNQKTLYKELSIIENILNKTLYKELKKVEGNKKEFQTILHNYINKYGKKCKSNSCLIVFNKYIYTTKTIKELQETTKIAFIENLMIDKFKGIKNYCIHNLNSQLKIK